MPASTSAYALFEIAMLLVYFKACMGLEMLSGRDMKEACFVNLQKLSLDYYNVTSAGHTLSRVMSDTDRIAYAASRGFFRISSGASRISSACWA